MVWPSLIELASSIGETDVWMYVIVAVVSNLFSLVCFNSLMWLIYSGKIGCFEKFRVNPQVKIFLNRSHGLGRKIGKPGAKH